MKRVVIFEYELPVNQSAYISKNTWGIRFAYDKNAPNKNAIGWTTSKETDFQVNITFENLEKALTFAENSGYVVENIIHAPVYKKHINKSYADNFKHNRIRPF